MARSHYDPYGKKKHEEIPPSIIGFVNLIRLSKDGTKYVYNCDKDADPNSEGKSAFDVANEQLKELNRLKKEQVLNIETLEKGSFMNIAGVFASVGKAMLNKCNARIGKIVFKNKRNQSNFIAIVADDREDVKKLVKFMKEIEKE